MTAYDEIDTSSASVLVVCGDGPLTSPWDTVLKRASAVMTTVSADELLAGWAGDPQAEARWSHRLCLVLGIGAGAREACRMARALPGAFRLVVADCPPPRLDVPDQDLPVLDVPLTVLVTDPARSRASAQIPAWRRMTRADFEVRLLPSPDDGEAFQLSCLRHLHEAGLLADRADRGDALGIRG